MPPSRRVNGRPWSPLSHKFWLEAGAVECGTWLSTKPIRLLRRSTWVWNKAEEASMQQQQQQQQPLSSSLEDVPPPGIALVEELDKLLLVQLRDGRKLVGILRSFDQFANLVLEQATERVIVGSLYAEVPLGLHVVRGENVVLLGEIDEARDPPASLTKVTEQEIRQAQKAEKEQEKIKQSMKARMDFLDFE
ncbi:hypothetical protein WJX74_006843 [Apatococcus lobatus]|uniref:U6 snRNA-associated Sm-like protein LSm1 n=2 Tax=Apatococcus TaxID=904362 RepID=A0AAW1STZ0_9CHLO